MATKSNARTKRPAAGRRNADRVEVRIKKRSSLSPRGHRAGDIMSVEDFKEAYPKYEDYRMGADFKFNSKSSEFFELLVNGEPVAGKAKKVPLAFGGNAVTIDDDGETATCRGEEFDIDELEDFLTYAEPALDVYVPSANNDARRIELSNRITIGCTSGTVEEIRTIVDAALALRD